MEIHFIDVGQGNMVLIQIPNSKTILYDCNITEGNEYKVFRCLRTQLSNSKIDIFINSHRDSDHMRGIKKINEEFTIASIWDSGVHGTTTDSDEYQQYMELKRKIGEEKEPLKYWTFGDCILRLMNGRNDEFQDANEQSLVVKLEYFGNGILLTGDSSCKSWKDFILPNYSDSKIKSSILLGSHHGSTSFFDDPEDLEYYYENHIKKIKPKLTVISVGDNDTHPDEDAITIYKKHSTGYGKDKIKILTTKDNGTIKFEFREDGSSSYWTKQ